MYFSFIIISTIIPEIFVKMIEMDKGDVKFLSVDAEIADSMKAEDVAEKIDGIEDIFKKVVPETTKIEFESLKDTALPAILNITEESRRMEEMMRMYAKGMSYPTEATLILNTQSEVIKTLPSLPEETAMLKARYIYKLCLLTQSRLDAESLKEFLKESYDILEKVD